MKLQNEITRSQERSILLHLQTGRGITPADAIKLYSCYRLAARISDLRSKGYDIQTSRIPFINKGGKTGYYARYTLTQKQAEPCQQ